MKPVLLYPTLLLVALACAPEEDIPTGPLIPGRPTLAEVGTTANSWSTRAAYPGDRIDGGFTATAPNAAGQSIVYYLGGEPRSEEESIGMPVKAYNVATDTWTTRAAKVEVWFSNGAGKIGSRIYFSGGLSMDDDLKHELFYTSAVWAYDYSSDRMIRRADLPIISAEGVSGVIGDKLYVLPGICSTLSFPDPGYCSKLSTRRFFRYDPATDRWASRPWAPHNHARGAAGVIQGRLFVVGGADPYSDAAIAELDMYDPATNDWTSLAPIPTGGPAIGAVVSGKFLVVVKTRDGSLRSYEYDPETNVWKARAAPAFAHEGIVKVTMEGRSNLLAVGGAHGLGLATPNPSELYTRQSSGVEVLARSDEVVFANQLNAAWEEPKGWKRSQ